jgi:hypothetical protein
MFKSFFLAGYEGSTGFNKHGEWFDQVVATGHDRTLDSDYSALERLGIRAARDCVRWPLVDKGRGRYDFSTVMPMVDASNRHGVEIVWDLFHYGYPRDLDLFSREFTQRFADYCYEVGRFLAKHVDSRLWFTPVNEPSFFAYAGGEAGLFAPHLNGRGWDVKVALCRAAIAGIEALWVAAPGCRMVNVDPLCRVVAPTDRPGLDDQVRAFNERAVFQSWDMITGRLLPELGGSAAHLDVVGINYYWTNQWELGSEPREDGTIPPLADGDPRRLSLSDLVEIVWRRYGHEMIIGETAHVAEQRGPWLREVASEATKLIEADVPLRGICLYPILGMPEWHAPDIWAPMGLWDPECHDDPCGKRLICTDMAQALREASHLDDLLQRQVEEREAHSRPAFKIGSCSKAEPRGARGPGRASADSQPSYR